MTAQLSHFPGVGAPPGAHRLLRAETPGLPTHSAVYGPLPRVGREFIDVVGAAGLTGRGGAGFPVARKLAAVATGRAPIVVGNGAEGEPLSRKDAVLLTRAPHLVLDGLAVAAAAVGADRCHLYAPPAVLEPVRRALAERGAAGLGPRVELTAAPDHFLAGEKTAVVNRLAGRAALPRDQRISTSERGARGRPTLVQNVETLAHLALIARFGPHWFRSVGTPDEPGTMLVTLSGSPVGGVFEVPRGTNLLEIITRLGRTDPARVRAVLVGGYHGSWVPAARLGATPLSRTGLRDLRADPGAGVLRILTRDECGLRATADITAYLAAQSAGQCGPCRNGLPPIAGALTHLAHGGPGDPREIEYLTGLVDGRGTCHHPDGTARLVRSALTAFADDVTLHRKGLCHSTFDTERTTA
ncbi:NADH-ubiquinone oxidoreductase-F iron-sulfur binding region domain-containing protein [Nocardia sp. NPDC004068]|uniref:NADH-ubiquinone oxidoreductase-F iron-sulfur binding region domain-containing protein n=1 Tax=Nocardia sp. NPDC004068 TaxID=3364303 RepID=UPI0036BD0967